MENTAKERLDFVFKTYKTNPNKMAKDMGKIVIKIKFFKIGYSTNFCQYNFVVIFR